MWPYTVDEHAWLCGEEHAVSAFPAYDPSPKVIRQHIAKGRALRAHYIQQLGRRFCIALRRLAHKGRRDLEPSAVGEQFNHDLRTPLTAIRLLSEILRDHPDLPDRQRQRYLAIILSESARLETAIRRHDTQPAPDALK